MNVKIVNNIPCGTLRIRPISIFTKLQESVPSIYPPLFPSTNLELCTWYAFEEDCLYVKMRGSITSMLYFKKKFEIDNPLTQIEFL